MSIDFDIHAFLLLFVTCSHVACGVRNWCESTCLPKLSDKDNEGCDFSSEVIGTECNDWSFRSNITNATLGEVVLSSFTYSSLTDYSKVIGLNMTFTNIKFNYLQLQCKEIQDANASCHVFNISQQIGGISHNCLWPHTAVGTEMEMKYQVSDTQTAVVDEGHYIFRVPNLSRIEPEVTPVQDWEFFLYIDVSDITHVIARWRVPPTRLQVQYYLVQLLSGESETSSQVIESHQMPVSTTEKEELCAFETDSLSGSFYISVEILHDNCTYNSCYVSKSPVFTIDYESKSPLIIAVIGILILLPAFLYVLHSWRRFGALPPHKAPVVLLIYKRTMDTHFRVIVALVMYLRRACHIRALIEDFDILSADTQDSSSWYREAFSRVDAVMVVSSPHHMGNDKEKAYYNVNPSALHILAEKSNDTACSLRLFSVILPYCTEQDVPKEAENLPKFKLPQELNAMLWFIRFGVRTSWFSEIEYYFFQSQINGGTCDYTRYGRFLRDALVDANEESRRLWAMLTEAQRL